jgi:hypothetical protein
MVTGFDLCRAAVAVTGISAPEQSVLMVLAIMANEHAQCWPAINGATGLTGKTKLKERTVQNATKALEAAGHITRVERPGRGMLYTVHPRTSCTPAGHAPPQEVRPAGGAPTPAGGAPKQPRTTTPSKASPSSERGHVPATTRMLIAHIAVSALIAGCTGKPIRSTAAKARWPKDMPPPPAVTDDQWAGYIDHRRAKRERLTPRAYELLCGRLAKVTLPGWPPGRIIDTIVERGWLTFEEAWIVRITEQEHGTGNHNDRRRGGAQRQRGAYRDPLLAHYAGGADPGLG